MLRGPEQNFHPLYFSLFVDNLVQKGFLVFFKFFKKTISALPKSFIKVSYFGFAWMHLLTKDGYFDLLFLNFKLLLSGENFKDFFLEVLNAVEERCQVFLVVVEKGVENIVAGLTSEQLQPVPKLHCIFPLQKLELLTLVDFVDNIEIFFLHLPESKLLVDGLPGLLKQCDKLIFHF